MRIMRAMKYGYARVSTDDHSVAAQAEQLTHAGAEKVFREKVSGAVTHRQQLQKVLDALEESDILLVTRLDRLPRSTRDLLNILALIAEKNAGFRATHGPTPPPRTAG
jgi:DNA invertase Pin-like site-specific DNA recombinase